MLLQPCGGWIELGWVGRQELETVVMQVYDHCQGHGTLSGGGKQPPHLSSLFASPAGASHWPNQPEAREQESLGGTAQGVTFQATEQGREGREWM